MVGAGTTADPRADDAAAAAVPLGFDGPFAETSKGLRRGYAEGMRYVEGVNVCRPRMLLDQGALPVDTIELLTWRTSGAWPALRSSADWRHRVG